MSEVTTDHDTIRKWAESKGGKPAAVDRTHHDGDVGIIRIMFPKNAQSEHGSLVEISWDEFFEQFEESQLALLYEKDSLFSKIIGRDTAEKRAEGEYDAARPDGGGPARGHKATHGAQAGKSGAASSASKSSGGEKRAERSGKDGGAKGGSEDADLKAREYRDAEGNIHHHTKSYMKEHGGGQSR